MTDNINRIAQNVNDNKQVQQQNPQQTSASIVNLTDEDVIKIWDAVSAHIESYLKQSKGVIIPGFGTFSFIHKRIDIGNNKYLLIQRPVFSLSEKVVQTHGLKFTRHPVNGSIPVHSLNYFYLQTQSIYTRDQIEQCVKHVLQVFNRSISAQRNVEFTFSRIGKLQIRNGKVKMKFFKDFINSIDENNGKQVIENMCNRPQTCDSVMSEREATRPATSSNVVLPRINSRIGNSTMQAIQEENQADGDQQDSSGKDGSSLKSDLNHSVSRLDDFKLPPLLETSREPDASTTPSHVIKTTGAGSTNDGVIPIASLFSTSDLLPQPLPTTKRSATPMKRKPTINSTEQITEQTAKNPPTTPIAPRPIPKSISTLGFTRSNADTINARDRISSSLNVYPQQYQQILTKSVTSCGHYDVGQEMCRVCDQRAKRNIPVFLHEEKRIREEEEERLLEQYQHNRDIEERKKQEETMKIAREEKQKVAAFNLGIAEAVRAKKHERPQTTDIPRSIIFRKRAKTPPSFIRQQDFARQLEAQIKLKHDEQHSEKQDKDFIERLEQIQLAESLVEERENYFRNKRLRQEELKATLENQIRNRSNGLPVNEADAPYFGSSEMTSEQLRERRRHAVDIVRQQKDLIERRQRQDLLRQVQDQEYELKTLNLIKSELKVDQHERYERTRKIRKDLETDWKNSVEDKHKRDNDEKMFLKAPQGILVHEQCDQYKRCAQCQRDLDNCGKTNLWKETRYVPGARIMV